MPKTVIIDALPRSGGTFFSRVLNAFPDAYVMDDPVRVLHYYAEEHYPEERRKAIYPGMMLNVETPDLKMVPGDESFIKDIFSKVSSAEVIEPALKKRLLDYFSGAEGRDYSSLFGDTLEIMKGHYGKSTGGLHLTYHHRFAASILKEFSDVYWVALVRDPRAIYASSQKSHVPLHLGFLKDSWKDIVSTVRKLEGEDRFSVVRYEDLVLNPENTINDLADFLNIDINPTKFLEGLSLKDNLGKEWYSNSSFGRDWHDTSRKAEYFDPVPVDRWEDKLCLYVKDNIYAYCHDEMRYMGYERHAKRKSRIKEFYGMMTFFFFNVFRQRAYNLMVKLRDKGRG